LSKRVLALAVPAGVEMAAAWVVDQHEVSQSPASGYPAPRSPLRPMSPRRLRDSLDTIKATAALAGANRVTYDHLIGLVQALSVGGGAGCEDEEQDRIRAEREAVRPPRRRAGPADGGRSAGERPEDHRRRAVRRGDRVSGVGCRVSEGRRPDTRHPTPDTLRAAFWQAWTALIGWLLAALVRNGG